MSKENTGNSVYNQVQSIKSNFDLDRTGRYCPVCFQVSSGFIRGGVVKKRANAKCPSCGALERHRLFSLYFTNHLMPRITRPEVRVLHVAPEGHVAKLLKSIEGVSYLSGDLFMPNVDVKLDLTDIEFPDNTFDIILCSHVLEHIPDDAKAMQEMFRVIRPGGFLLVMVPLSGSTTYEDPSITNPQDRIKHFGQDDHVRLYGEDITQRLSTAGFDVMPLRYTQKIEPWLVEYAALKNEIIFECYKPINDISHRDKKFSLSRAENVSSKICNICLKGDRWLDKGSRKGVKCAYCGSLERARLLWAFLDRVVNVQKDWKVLHFAPERGIQTRLVELVGSNYQAADLSVDHENYKKLPVKPIKLDMVTDLESISAESYDLILHSHVLEHIPCSLSYVFYHLHRILKPSGFHTFVMPFMHGYWDESFDPTLTNEDRRSRFGQWDHVRRVGKADISISMGKFVNMDAAINFDALQYFSADELSSWNIPSSSWKGMGMDTCTILRKHDYLL